MDKNVVRCHDFNKAMPDNLYLCPGGSGPQTSYPFKQRGEIATALREALEMSESTWKVVCDTDGDQGFSDYTKIAHALCDSCVIPLKTNVNDFSVILPALPICTSQVCLLSSLLLIIEARVDSWNNCIKRQE